eukprot:s965_g18.t2
MRTNGRAAFAFGVANNPCSMEARLMWSYAPTPSTERIVWWASSSVVSKVLCQAACHQATKEISNDKAPDSPRRFLDGDHAPQPDGRTDGGWDAGCCQSLTHVLERCCCGGIVQQNFCYFGCQAAGAGGRSFSGSGQVWALVACQPAYEVVAVQPEFPSPLVFDAVGLWRHVDVVQREVQCSSQRSRRNRGGLRKVGHGCSKKSVALKRSRLAKASRRHRPWSGWLVWLGWVCLGVCCGGGWSGRFLLELARGLPARLLADLLELDELELRELVELLGLGCCLQLVACGVPSGRWVQVAASPRPGACAQVEEEGSGPVCCAGRLGWDVLEKSVVWLHGGVAPEAHPFGVPCATCLVVGVLRNLCGGGGGNVAIGSGTWDPVRSE